MGKFQADPYFRSVRAQVLGVLLGVCLIAPPLIGLDEDRWTGVDRFFVIGAVAFIIFWLSAAIIGWRTRRGNAGHGKSSGTRPPDRPQTR